MYSLEYKYKDIAFSNNTIYFYDFNKLIRFLKNNKSYIKVMLIYDFNNHCSLFTIDDYD